MSSIARMAGRDERLQLHTALIQIDAALDDAEAQKRLLESRVVQAGKDIVYKLKHRPPAVGFSELEGCDEDREVTGRAQLLKREAVLARRLECRFDLQRKRIANKIVL